MPKTGSQKVIIIASFAPSILNFRKLFIQALLLYSEVVVLAPEYDEQTTRDIIALGVRYIQINFNSRGINPVSEYRVKKKLTAILEVEKPTVVFSYTIKPVIWGSLAAKCAHVPQIYSLITGLGYVFTEVKTIRKKLLQRLIIFFYKKALACNNVVFFQNRDDKILFEKLKIRGKDQQSIVINGSGVDLKHFFQVPYVTTHPVRFLMISRLLLDKGIGEYLAAAKIIKEKYPETECHLVGYIDDNPSAIPERVLEEAIHGGYVIFHGKLNEVRGIIANCSVFVLPSYREGTPKSVLEAMAVGRPIITTDAPGCRETVKPGINGYLVPIKNVEKLVEKMQVFIENPELIEEMGKASRRLAEEKYDVHQVNQDLLMGMQIVKCKKD